MMAALREVGVVVVGLGIAGRVRVRDLLEETCGLRLRGVVSRRPVDLEGVTAFGLDEALKRSDVDAVIISTEPSLHEEYVRKGLESGKHVLVEYPMALSSAKALEFYKMAESKGLMIHEENIALFTDAFEAVKEKALEVELKSASFTLKGSYNGWLEDFDKSGLPFITGISGIQTMLALFGDLTVRGGKLEKNEDGYTATAQLETLQGKPIHMTLSRSKSKEARRQKHTVYEFEDGEILDSDKLPQQTKSKPGLFMRDMEQFYGLVTEGKISQARKYLSLRSLEIAEKIHSFF